MFQNEGLIRGTDGAAAQFLGSVTAAGAEEVASMPATGYCFYLTDLVVTNADTDETVFTLTAGATVLTLNIAAGIGTGAALAFNRPIKFATGDVTAEVSGLTGDVAVILNGFWLPA